MSQGSNRTILKCGKAASFCLILLLFPQKNEASTRSGALSRLTEEMFQRAEPKLLKDDSLEFPSKTILESPEMALKDPNNRISPDFKIPAELEKRVAFWFDVYTKYNETHHIIHHVRYPWIVYDVVDTSEILANEKLHRWTRYHQAKAHVAKRLKETRLALKSLAKKKSFSKLKGAEKRIYDQLASLSGKRSQVFALARDNVRTQLGQRDFILKGLSHSTRYLTYMEEEFRAAGLPTELTRLPFVESSFNPHAESKVGASGIWQIMPRTGKAYLTVNDAIDERNSPLKASFVAIELFRSNYRSLKDWPLAVTAYNHGATGVKNNLKKSRSTTLVEMINRLHSGSFKFASANFYTSFLAVLHAEKYHREIFHDLDFKKEAPIRYSVYSLDRRMRAKNLTSVTGVDHNTFVSLNLDLKVALRNNAWIPKGFKVLVPFERRYELDTKLRTGLSPVREAKVDGLNSKSKGS